MKKIILLLLTVLIVPSIVFAGSIDEAHDAPWKVGFTYTCAPGSPEVSFTVRDGRTQYGFAWSIFAGGSGSGGDTAWGSAIFTNMGPCDGQPHNVVMRMDANGCYFDMHGYHWGCNPTHPEQNRMVGITWVDGPVITKPWITAPYTGNTQVTGAVAGLLNSMVSGWLGIIPVGIGITGGLMATLFGVGKLIAWVRGGLHG